MAVLNGERMHDTMERLLPGARSAALLWQGAAVLGGAGGGKILCSTLPGTASAATTPTPALTASGSTLTAAGAASAPAVQPAANTPAQRPRSPGQRQAAARLPSATASAA